MARSLNRATLIGHLGTDPEIRTFQGGGRVANLAIATSESWKTASGERKERTEWHRVVIHVDGLGAKVYVEGKLETRKWTDKDGRETSTTEIALRPYAGELLMLDARKDQPGSGDEPEDGEAPD